MPLFHRTSIALLLLSLPLALLPPSFSAATSSSDPTTLPVPEQLKHACCPFPAHSGQSVHLAARGAEKGCQRTALRPWQTEQRRLPGVEEQGAEEVEVEERRRRNRSSSCTGPSSWPAAPSRRP